MLDGLPDRDQTPHCEQQSIHRLCATDHGLTLKTRFNCFSIRVYPSSSAVDLNRLLSLALLLRRGNFFARQGIEIAIQFLFLEGFRSQFRFTTPGPGETLR